MAPSTNSSFSNNGNRAASQAVAVTMEAIPERRLIRPTGSFRHVVYHIQVAPRSPGAAVDRLPLRLALVLDRSGSMQGEKLETAKRSALAVLHRLDERDRVAVVVFDNVVDVVHPAAAATAALKAQVRSALAEIHARATTALHEGWLTGCQAIAGESTAGDGRLARCFLLTDGLANVGLTDPEQIAGEAAGIYGQAGIGTSTFGFGRDYSQELLGPMAVAGGGQFHHLRTVDDITSTFVGELGDLFDVTAARARLELETSPGVTVDMISAYRASALAEEGQRWSVPLGDLLAGDDRQVVVRFGLPGRPELEELVVRARLVWEQGGVEFYTGWQAVFFSYADSLMCDAEACDPSAMHWIGLHHAQRAKRQASAARQAEELQAARRDLSGVARNIRRYAGGDADLLAAIPDLESLADRLAEKPMEILEAKEQYFQSQRFTRGQKDHRRS